MKWMILLVFLLAGCDSRRPPAAAPSPPTATPSSKALAEHRDIQKYRAERAVRNLDDGPEAWTRAFDKAEYSRRLIQEVKRAARPLVFDDSWKFEVDRVGVLDGCVIVKVVGPTAAIVRVADRTAQINGIKTAGLVDESIVTVGLAVYISDTTDVNMGKGDHRVFVGDAINPSLLQMPQAQIIATTQRSKMVASTPQPKAVFDFPEKK